MNLPAIDPVWLTFAGRLHPLLLHLPIGVFVGLGVLELFAALRGKPAAPTSLVVFGGVMAALSAGSGWLLHEEPGYGGDLLEWHEWLGISVGALGLLTAILRMAGRTSGYRRLLALTVVVLLPTAHFGASMTHGTDFLLEPFHEQEEDAGGPAPFQGLSVQQSTPKPPPIASEPAPAEPAVTAAPTASYAVDIAPLFQARCVTCHGERKKKGKLRLDAPEHILAGGVIGDTVVPGDPAGSEIMYRLELPAGDEDKMPPPEKPQPSAAEVALIRTWIAAGAPFDEPFALPAGFTRPDAPPPAAEEPEQPETSAAPSPSPPAGPEPPSRRDLAALREALVHVQPVAEGSPDLWIDFAAPAAGVDDDLAQELLEPVREHVAELSLARTKVTDAILPLVADMPQLRRLDLRATRVTDAGLAQLAGHEQLTELVLVRAQLSDAAVDTLLDLPSLAAVWVWESGLTPEAVARLRAGRPALQVDAGDDEPAEPLELEPEPVFTSDASPVDAVAPPAGLEPVNTTCPVSGSPVNPKYTIVYEGRVIGFCCPNCPKQFWDDPESFLAKLP